MPRERLTRHELKSKDEITTKLTSFTDLVVDRKKEAIVLAAAVVAIALALVGWRYYSASRVAAAQGQLAMVISAYSDRATPEKDRYQKTIVEAQKVVDAYGSTRPALIAKYFSALGQDGLGDTAKAIQTLEEVAGSGDNDVQGVAAFALAGIYQRHGETQKAIDTLKKLFDSGGFSKGAVAIELGKLFEAQKQPDQARDYYNKVILELGDSTFRQEAEAALKRLGFPVPTPQPPAPAPS